MSINIRLPHDAGPRTRALAEHLQAISNDREHHRYEDLWDTAVGGLISLVGELERDIDAMKAAAVDAERQTTWDELQRRSYETSR